MKKSKLLLLFTLIIPLLVFVNSCVDDDSGFRSTGSDKTSTGNEWKKPRWSRKKADLKALSKAQEWFETQRPKIETVMTRSSDGHPLFGDMEPNWKQCYTHKGNGYTSVEVTLLTQRHRLIIMPCCQGKYYDTGDKRYMTSLTRLIFLKPDDGTEPIGFFITISPSVKYIDKTNFRPYYNSYPVRDPIFDGRIYYHDLEGNFVNGWEYEDGKIIMKLFPPDPEKPRTRGLICTEIYERVCFDLGGSVNAENEVVSSAHCEDVLIDMHCVDSSPSDGGNFEDGDLGNTDGGGNWWNPGNGGWGDWDGGYKPPGNGNNNNGDNNNTVTKKVNPKIKMPSKLAEQRGGRCMAYSLYYTFRLLGKEARITSLVKMLRRDYGIDFHKNGMNIEKFNEYIKANCHYSEYKEYPELPAYTSAVDNGYFVIVGVNNGGDRYGAIDHALLVIGYNSDKTLVTLDPETGKERMLDRSNVISFSLPFYP